MLDPDTLREIQRLMNEDPASMCDPAINGRRIARLLGLDPGVPGGGEDEKKNTPVPGGADNQELPPP